MILFRVHNLTGDVTAEIVNNAGTDGLNAAVEVNRLLGQGHERSGGDARLFNKLVPQAQVLTDLLLSPEQQQQLRSLPEGCSLTVTAPLSLHQVPFELIRIGDNFLCERFAMGRIVQDGMFPAAARLKTRAATVLVADSGDLISTNTEQTIVKRRLRQLSHDHPATITELTSSAVRLTVDGVRDALANSCWLHFAGHASEVDGVRCLEISSSTGPDVLSQYFTPSDLQSSTVTPEVVFLNACGALQLPADESGQHRPTLVSELLQRGTKWLIGPVVPVLDSQTRHLTTEFYDAIGRGCSMGEALRQARLHAKQKLGPHNLLPFSYVLYGHPATSMFPVKSAMNVQQQMPPRTAVVEPSFPCQCNLCGKLIETRHGVGQRPLESDRVVCCQCVRTSNDDLPRDRSVAASSSSFQRMSAGRTENEIAPSQEPAPSQASDMQASPAERAFHAHVDECLGRTVKWMDLTTGQKVKGSFRRITNEADHQRKSGLTVLDGSALEPAADRLRQYELLNQNGKPLATVGFMILEGGSKSDERPLTATELSSFLRQTTSAASELQQYVFVCSVGGFADDCRTMLNADLRPEWYGAEKTVYLHDVANKQTHRRTADLTSHSLASVLLRETTAQQFQQTVVALENQLPLVTSLGSRDFSRQLGFEIDAVESAMRYIASQHNLALEQTSAYGLIVAESGPSITTTTVGNPGKLSGLNKALNLVKWPLKQLAGLLRRLFF